MLIRIRSLPCDGPLVHIIYWTNRTLIITLGTVSWVCSWQRVLGCIKQFHQTVTVPSFLGIYVSARWCSPDFAMILIKPDFRLVVHWLPWELVTLTPHQWSFHDLTNWPSVTHAFPGKNPFTWSRDDMCVAWISLMSWSALFTTACISRRALLMITCTLVAIIPESFRLYISVCWLNTFSASNSSSIKDHSASKVSLCPGPVTSSAVQSGSLSFPSNSSTSYHSL